MSSTKHMRRNVIGASNEQLIQWEHALARMADSERNPMVRSSLRKRLDIVRHEQQRRDLAGKVGA